MIIEPRSKTPGLRWRSRMNNAHRVAIWCCPEAIAKIGYPIKTVRLWAGGADQEPTSEEWASISATCIRLHEEARGWRDHGDRPRSRRGRDGLVYFVRSGEKVKIGFANDLDSRVRHLQNSAPTELEIMGTIAGTKDIERFLHHIFRKRRLHGEWFSLDQPLREFIHEHARPWREDILMRRKYRVLGARTNPEDLKERIQEHGTRQPDSLNNHKEMGSS